MITDITLTLNLTIHFISQVKKSRSVGRMMTKARSFCFTDQIKFMRETYKSDAPLHSFRTEISYFSIILTITCNVGLKKGHKLRSRLLHCVYCVGKHYLIAANVLIFAHYFITFGEK